MREKDQTRLKDWIKNATDNPKFRTKEVWVDNVGEPGEVEYGFCQVLEIFWGKGFPDTVNCFWDDSTFSVPEDFKGKIDMRIKWMDGYWKGELAEPLPPKEDWAFAPQASVDKQTMIVRQSSVRSAVELSKSGLVAFDKDKIVDPVRAVINAAEEFENYVLGK